MTCIVGIVEKGHVYIGGDSASSNTKWIKTKKDSKVYKRGDFIVGMSGRCYVIQEIKHSFIFPWDTENLTPMEFMIRNFIPALKTFLKAVHRKFDECSMIIGYKHHLFTVCDDLTVHEWINDFDAVGSGEEYAIGALHALTNTSIPTKEKVERALAASAEYCKNVKPPFFILKS